MGAISSPIDPAAAIPAAVRPVAPVVEIRAGGDDDAGGRHNGDAGRCPAVPADRPAPAVTAAPGIAAPVPARALPAIGVPAVPAAGIDELHVVDDIERRRRIDDGGADR